MNNLNSILVEGNLVRDPEPSYTSSVTIMCVFIVDCDRSWKQEARTMRHSC